MSGGCANSLGRSLSSPVKLFRSGAAQIARDLAEIAAKYHHDQPSAESWRDIAAAIERLWQGLTDLSVAGYGK
jgi:hypothetical protein